MKYTWIVLCLLPMLAGSGEAEDAKQMLQGTWIATSMEADGKPAPDEVLKLMRMTFQGDKLLVRGNFQDDREESCDYRIDAKASPRRLDIHPPKEDKPVQAIYEVKGDVLKICLRHSKSTAGPPTTFETKPGSSLVLLVLTRRKP